MSRNARVGSSPIPATNYYIYIMIKDNLKHHKYVTVNKHERKKLIKFIKPYLINENWFKCLKPIYSLYLELRKGYRYYYGHKYYYNYQTSKHKLVWDDCNHTTCRILYKKYNKFTYLTTRPFKGINYKINIKHFTRQQLNLI